MHFYFIHILLCIFAQQSVKQEVAEVHRFKGICSLKHRMGELMACFSHPCLSEAMPTDCKDRNQMTRHSILQCSHSSLFLTCAPHREHYQCGTNLQCHYPFLIKFFMQTLFLSTGQYSVHAALGRQL